VVANFLPRAVVDLEEKGLMGAVVLLYTPKDFSAEIHVALHGGPPYF
jgi:hypothetical protein